MALVFKSVRLGTDNVDYSAADAASLAAKITGPASATDNAAVRFDATTGKLVQNSLVTFDDSGNVALLALATVDGRDVSVDGATLDTAVTNIATNTAAARGFRGKGNAAADATAADYTAVLDDAGKLIHMNRATAQTATIPPNGTIAYVVNQDVLTWVQDGAGAFTVTAGAGVTLILPPGKTAVSNGVGAIVSAVKTGTNTWNVYGDLVPS